MNRRRVMGEQFHGCDAGRRATYWGRWTIPCLRAGTNMLAFSAEVGGSRMKGSPILYFCHDHMGELIADGVIDEVAVEPDEFDRRSR